MKSLRTVLALLCALETGCCCHQWDNCCPPQRCCGAYHCRGSAGHAYADYPPGGPYYNGELRDSVAPPVQSQSSPQPRSAIPRRDGTILPQENGVIVP